MSNVESSAPCRITPSRIFIFGCSGAGKSSLARALSTELGIQHLELDQVVWKQGWEMKSEQEWAPVVHSFMREDSWIVDGNYDAVRSELLKRATHLIWLDPSFLRIVRNLFHRAIFYPERFHGNKESLTRLLCSKESILLWVCKTFRKRRTEYQRLYDDVCSAKTLSNVIRILHVHDWQGHGSSRIIDALLKGGDRCQEM